ncbi:hypothetical protein POF50_019055 [Streptomyces sp. SL13]|uniref:Uncharacterized protein n=1 Tax=Streptantibioticus silvisoli TaxID=2705255 RepID=A0AA90H174_9ACTN|nr:hypothetical protein [Streptantibioticus silvisoli]MDI5971409.1 hypothetical protein [Streptantibioticus silvisoli]
MAVAYTIGNLPQPFSVHDVEAKLGVAALRIGLTMNFFEYCGLVTDAPGRGTYLATPAATQVAEAWAKDVELGKAALRRAWNQTWFTKSARNRLAQGPGLREGLHARFTMLAGGAVHRRSIDKLLDLMVLAGLLIEEPDGFVRWYASANDAAEDRRSPDAEDTAPDREDGTTASPGGSWGPHDRAVPTYEDDPAELLADPLWFKYVRYLTAQEATDLHRQLHGVLGILSQARAHAHADNSAPAVELAQPLHLWDLGRVSLETWLDVYASSRKMSTFIPSMRSRQSTPMS